MKLYSNKYIDNIVNIIVEKDVFEKNFKYHYLFILTYIRTYKFKDRRFTNDMFVPVNMKFLRKLVSYDYANKFMSNLINYGILETDNTFEVGKKSRGYRLNSNCYNDRYYLVANKDFALEKKVKKAYDKIKTDIIDRKDSYGYITYCMENLNIDKPKALEFIKNTVTDIDKKESYEIVTEIFEDKFAIVDNTSNRLHNNLTNLYTPLRQFLNYNGEEIIQCDIRNSQLVFLYVMLRKYHVPEKELKYFGEVVCEIGFYEFFAAKLNRELTEDNRKEFKSFIFKDILFGSNKLKLNEIETVFKKIFPFIFYVMRKLKMDDYTQLSIQLQKAESEFIYNCIDKIGRDIPLLTIHDSIGTTAGNENRVKSIIEKEFLENYGVIPKIRLEKFAQ